MPELTDVESLAQMAYICEQKARQLRADPAFMETLPQVFVSCIKTTQDGVLTLSTYGMTTRMEAEIAILTNAAFLVSDYPVEFTGKAWIHIAELLGGFVEELMGLHPEERLTPGSDYVVRGTRCRVRLEVKTTEEVVWFLSSAMSCEALHGATPS